jgi:hypothetical protein
MRQLRKLIFINSANIPYGEVLLDGNVHFIGTQGVGKSTLLRAILFFYNAKITQLGIPTEKQSFLEYYFANINAHLIYEVQTDKHVYCVWAFKSQNRICYRLIDQAYNRDFFIENNHSKTEKEVQKTLNELGVAYTAKRIDNYEDYRDIIYGNSKREFKKYAILESNAYQNIPRTISNVFLNSKLEATFIKNTIINSITEDKDKVSIELNSTRKNVVSFQKSYDEIHIFKRYKKQGENIIDSYHQLLNHKKILQKTAQQLGIALRNAQGRIGELIQNQYEKNQIKEGLNLDLEQLINLFNTESQLFKDGIAVLKNKVQSAISQRKYYDKEGIEGILNLHQQKPTLQIELVNAQKEQHILTAKYRSIDDRYQRLFEQIEDKKKAFQNLHDKHINDLESEWNCLKFDLERKEQTAISTLHTNFLEQTENTNQAFIEARQTENEAMFQLKDIQKTTFRQAELDAIRKDIQTIKDSLRQIDYDLKTQKQEKLNYEKEAQKRVEILEQQILLEQNALQQQIETAKKEFEITLKHIELYETTLYGFLDNQDDFEWRESIGKVFREEILLNTDLRPIFKKEKNTFFGLKINLESLPITAKTFGDFIHQRESLKKQLQDWQVDVFNLTEKLTDEGNKLRKKHNTKIRLFQKEIDRLTMQQNSDNHQLMQLNLDKNDLIAKAKIEKEKAIDTQQNQLNFAKENVLKIEQERRGIKQQLQKEERVIRQNHQGSLTVLATTYKSKKATFIQIFEAQKKSSNNEKEALNTKRQTELKGEGANINRLNTVENSIKTIQNQLETIDKNTSLVNEFHKDKRELIDKQVDFEVDLKQVEAELSTVKMKFKQEEQALKNIINQNQNELENIQNERNSLETEIKHFEENFKIRVLYQQLKQAINEPSKILKVKESINQLIGKLVGIQDEINRIESLLEQRISKFAGFFYSDNDLGLNNRLEQKSDFIAFAKRLEEIIDNDLITEKETETQKYFNQLLNNIAEETKTLNGLKSDIEAVISKINQDFRSGNFVDAVQKIELRTQESENKVVKKLMAIQKFKEANQNIGYEGLFSVLNQPTNAKKAIELLQNLAEEISLTKATTIHLEHSFELEFKVRENNNETPWVQRISNVGSNGTDVLVKAMVYIMLLSVFKNRASQKIKDFKIHCIIDEVGILHDSNLKGLLRFANERNIFLINGSPNPNDVSVYKHTYQLSKNKERQTQIRHLLKMNI